jgi:hypothetical protein
VGGGVSRGAAEEPLGEPKKSIGHQLELLKAGEVEKLWACFTERQRGAITKEAVEKGKKEAAKYTLNDLVASVEMGELQGKKTAKITMKNGRTLTTRKEGLEASSKRGRIGKGVRQSTSCGFGERRHGPA